MSKFVLTIDIDNAAFEVEELEVARVMRDLAEKMEYAEFTSGSQKVRDINGNTVGEAKFED